MYTIDKEYSITQTINKSIFICTLIPISDGIDAIHKLNSLKTKYYDATHNCYSYIFGENGENGKFSDDGEPSQTAGIIIYNVLKSNELTNILAVVTRYFGGIKLGAGGLVRAYSSSTALAIKDISCKELTKCINFQMESDYQNYNYLEKIFKNVTQTSKDFGNTIIITYRIKKTLYEETIKKALEITKNQIKITYISEETIPI